MSLWIEVSPSNRTCPRLCAHCLPHNNALLHQLTFISVRLLVREPLKSDDYSFFISFLTDSSKSLAYNYHSINIALCFQILNRMSHLIISFLFNFFFIFTNIQMFQWNSIRRLISKHSHPQDFPDSPHTSTAGGIGSTPDQGTKIPHAMRNGQKINKWNNQ